MELRRIGNSSIETIPFVLGGNVFGWTIDEHSSYNVLDAFVNGGGIMIDTADKYSVWHPGNSGGESELIIGKWLKRSGNRNKVLIATKSGMDMGGDRKGLSRRHITRSVDESLSRLGVDCIDLYQAHRDDPDTPFEETFSTYANLMKSGKIRMIGASNYSAARLEQAIIASTRLGLPGFQTFQTEYNLVRRENFEPRQQPLCIREQISVIPYFSLAHGFLTGKYRNINDAVGRIRGSAAIRYLNNRGYQVLSALDEIALRMNTSQTAVSIAWLRDRTTVLAPCISATTPDQLKELFTGTSLILDDDAIKLLNKSSI